MIIIHHNDLDGRCAAAVVVKYILAIGTATHELAILEFDYKRKLDPSLIPSDEVVVIVDFSFTPDVMAELLKRTMNVTWIDHHKTSVDYDYGCVLKGIREADGKDCGASLAWKYYFPLEDMPMAVRLTRDYDTWTHEMCGDRAFNEGMRLLGWAPESRPWQNLLNAEETCSTIIAAGETASKYRDSLCGTYRKHYGFEIKIDGYEGYALNLYTLGSQSFGELSDKYAVLAAFVFDGKDYTVSLYTERKDLDVSAICKKFGGGGHRQAAGFVCKDLPWMVKVGDGWGSRHAK